MAGDLNWAGVTDLHKYHLLGVRPHPHRLSGQGVGHEYDPCSNATMAVFSATVRVTPNAAV
jgi:hypothetical protein